MFYLKSKSNIAIILIIIKILILCLDKFIFSLKRFRESNLIIISNNLYVNTKIKKNVHLSLYFKII